MVHGVSSVFVTITTVAGSALAWGMSLSSAAASTAAVQHTRPDHRLDKPMVFPVPEVVSGKEDRSEQRDRRWS
jgi:hypothetical protein